MRRTSVYLYLTIITDGFDRDGGSDGAFGVPGSELYNALGFPHQAGHSAAVLQELLFLILETHTSKCQLFCSYLRLANTLHAFLLVYHGLLNEIFQSVQAACLITAVFSLNAFLQALKVVRGLFGITEKLQRP